MLENVFDHPDFREDRYWSRQRFTANETIITGGEQGRELFLIRRGSVRVTGRAQLEQGGVIHPGFCDLGPGNVFGEVGLLPGMTRMATVMAITDCELAVLDGAGLLEFFDAHPGIGYRVMLAMYAQTASRLDQTNQQLLRMLAWGLRVHKIEDHLQAGSGMAAGVGRLSRKTG